MVPMDFKKNEKKNHDFCGGDDVATLAVAPAVARSRAVIDIPSTSAPGALSHEGKLRVFLGRYRVGDRTLSPRSNSRWDEPHDNVPTQRVHRQTVLLRGSGTPVQ